MDENNDKIRVRIRLLKEAIEVREELKDMKNIFGESGLNTVFMINISDLSTVIMKGETQFDDSSFTGQFIKVNWKSEILSISPNRFNNSILCSVAQKNKRINCSIVA